MVHMDQQDWIKLDGDGMRCGQQGCDSPAKLARKEILQGAEGVLYYCDKHAQRAEAQNWRH